MKKKTLVLFFLILLVISSGCTVDKKETKKTKETKETLKGISVSPKSFAQDDFLGFLDKIKNTQDVLLWAGDWIEISEEKAPKTFTELAQQYDYIPLIEVGHYTQSSGKLIRPLTEKNKQIYMNSTVKFVKKYQPKYFGVGVEVNVFAQKNPEEFKNFVLFYNEIYDAIKKVSPETKVFTVFQLEKMKGLKMWEIEEAEPHWKMIDTFKSDLVAFTTYPGLFYKNPVDIPKNHYLEIRSHTSKPIAFTEVGWHSAASPKGWESDEAEQAEFIKTFFKLTNDLNPKMVIWTFMYNPKAIEPFNSMGLINDDETKKIAWNTWLKAK